MLFLLLSDYNYRILFYNFFISYFLLFNYWDNIWLVESFVSLSDAKYAFI